jgi:catechol 2,3-dioxygenase-like lactoylglutathione lyase family enzyme
MAEPIRTAGFHLAILVRSLDRSRAFYERLFGMTATFESPDIVILSTPGRHEQLALQLDPATVVDPILWNQRAVHFGFLVAEEAVDAAAQAVAAAGGRVLARGERRTGPYLFLRDPDGYTVELYADRE